MPPYLKFHPTTHAATELLRRQDLHKDRHEALLCCLGPRTSVKVLGFDWPRVWQRNGGAARAALSR